MVFRIESPSSSLKRFFCALVILVLQSLWLASAAFASGDGTFASLRRRLVQDGFEPMYVSKIFQPAPTPHFKTVSNTLRLRESRLNYAQFLNATTQARTLRQIEKHEDILDQAEKRYGVDRFTLSAILMVETRFGQYTGRTPTLDILATFAVMDQKRHRDHIWSLLPAKERERWGRAAFDEKLLQRSRWAYEELNALLIWCRSHPETARSLRGSVMGATGWPQFLPSSIVRYGVDADDDGRIDLFHPRDAIFSAANYLRGYGWNEASTRAQKEKVIWGYNHSTPYVEAVLGLAERLRARVGKAGG